MSIASENLIEFS